LSFWQNLKGSLLCWNEREMDDDMQIWSDFLGEKKSN
jgi:hypothetical protein